MKSLRMPGASDEMRKFPEISKGFNVQKDKNGWQFVEMLDAGSGEVLQTALRETSQNAIAVTTKSAPAPRLILSQRPTTVVQGATGQEEDGLIEGTVAVSPDDSRVAVQDESGQLMVYDMDSLEKLQEFTFTEKPVFVQFSQDGKKLLVVTDAQAAYFLDVPAAPSE